MPTFITDFQPPDPVTGLELEANLEESAVRLTWDPTTLQPVDFGGYRVYRVMNGERELMAHYTDVNEVSFEDYLAPLNVDITYEVTQANLDFEGDPAEASAQLASQAWWVVMPGDDSLTFPIRRIREAPVLSPKVQEIYAPIGRPTRIAVGDVVQTEEGSLSFLVMPDQPQMVNLLRAIQAQMEGSITLKAPDGMVHSVQFGSMQRHFTKVPGMFEVTLPFSGVG